MKADGILAGRYRLERILGAGGMGRVYAATDTVMERSVALKCAIDSSASSTESLEHEYTILKSLCHANIVSAFDLYKGDAEPSFFTMERVEGRPLNELIADKNDLLTGYHDRCLSFLVQIAETVGYVHSCGVAYCDLKPANIVVDESLRHIKLIDFGISQRLIPTAKLGTPSSTGPMRGTTHYMSPEQIRGEISDERSDVYSFGVLAFELVTGRLPFAGDGRFTITASHLLAKVPSAASLVKNVPRSFDRLLAVCLQKDPFDRYAEMTQVVQQLKRLQRRRAKRRFWWD